jgi:hypothetical protein
MRSLILVLGMMTILSPVYCQKTSVDQQEYKINGISFNMGGTSPVLGITYERAVSDKISLEFGVGFPSIGMGMKLFPYGIRQQKSMFHVGFTANYLNSGDGEITGFEGFILYLPIGLSYYGKNGFNFGIDAGPGNVREGFYSDLIPYGNIKIGKRF